MTKVTVITSYPYSARKSKNIIFRTFETAHGNIYLFVRHGTTDMCTEGQGVVITEISVINSTNKI